MDNHYYLYGLDLVLLISSLLFRINISYVLMVRIRNILQTIVLYIFNRVNFITNKL